jgi:hypothetical protein
MTDLEMNICDGIEDGMTVAEIAKWLDIPESWVMEAIESGIAPLDSDSEPDYNDDDSDALASAGWGTDEDYGGGSEYI